MPATPSLIFRAALALVLLLGFYVLAIGVGGLLLSVPIAEWNYLQRIDLRLAAVCVGAGGSILWSLRPRVDHFEPPGPALGLDQHPRLAAVISSVARATGQRTPDEVYAVGHVNAFVTQRGGALGFGSRRVMGLGLPLMAVVTVDELRAVLAHEFGHYHGGDVALGPLVYRTRTAIGRTLAATHGTVFDLPFTSYARLFLRASSAVSRHQEFVADALAASTIGAAALAGGLRQVEVAAHTFGAFLANELSPVVGAGFLPDISGGFRTFVSAIRITEDTRASEPTRPDLYDSHPPLSERIAAIGATDATRIDGEPAISLLERVPELELEVFRLSQVSQVPLSPIAWDDVPQHVYVPVWRSLAASNAEFLEKVSLDRLPTRPAETLAFALYLKDPKEGYVAGDLIARRFVSVVSAAFFVFLVDQGWAIRTGPGQPVRLVRGEDQVEPAARISGIVFGKESLPEWLETLRKLGVRTESLRLIQ